MLRGAETTIWLVIAILAIATPMSVLVAILMRSRFAVVRGATTIVGAFVRGIPPLLLLFTAYFVLPVAGIVLSPVQAAIAGLSLYIVFYFAECIRSGLAAIPAGQHDAVRALGLPRLRAARRVLLPQLLPVALPPFIGYATEVVKGSALASAISVAELTGNGYQMIMATGRTLPVLVVMGLLYAALDGCLLAVQALVTRRLKRATA
ncbi:amino acid ABC transporter permease (plasmid) [Lichenicola cladoniae]|uniref:Amino acid ABC transporter permease n=1 Tax=Lichenicola cladoniae TaxID=1484109 RepID=A0A6M8HY82_9PROT|nr:amino acid ABC transporter permease [Lichenicola cladoniae]NPD68669.1 amino acid ABC transporter permease [Acetobacteraceae bacterium]QKE93051.1 amino acid ABC transporter permease [Lichenicola cladoniae]